MKRFLNCFYEDCKLLLYSPLKAFKNKFGLIFVFFLFLSSTLNAQYDMSLRSVVEPRASVLGIKPDSDPEIIEKELIEKGMQLIEKKNPKGYLLSLKFRGLPKGLWIQEGKTSLFFFEGRLFRIQLSFAPSYANFLLIRKQLFRSLGSRFSIQQSQESIDNFLKSHLANLKDGEYSERTEKEIQEALMRGNTFYFYSLGDNKNELDVALSYSTKKRKGKLEPRLNLVYTFTNIIEEIQLFEQTVEAKILPQ